MSKNTATAAATTASVAKKVDKKADKKSEVAASSSKSEVPIVEAKKATEGKKAAASSKAAASPVVAAAVEAAPKAAEPAAAAEAVEEKSVDEQIKELIEANQKARELATAHIKVLQRIQKKVAKDLKEAGKRRRVKKEDNGVPKEKRPTIFTTPVTLKDELCIFLGKPKGSQMTPAEVTRAISKYVEDHKLKDATKGHTIHPDAAMRKGLSIKDGEEASYRSLQKVLYSRCYILPVKA